AARRKPADHKQNHAAAPLSGGRGSENSGMNFQTQQVNSERMDARHSRSEWEPANHQQNDTSAPLIGGRGSKNSWMNFLTQ
ncbi:MAG: hypothetical protein WD396_10395, partial [Pseudohongiellaceae bacterium]